MRVGAAALAGRRLMAGRRLALPSPTPKLRRRLLALVAVALLLAAGYQFWLRDSSLVAVEEVTVTGLTTEDGERVRTALVAAGHSMTTLHVDRELLDEAIAHYPVVRDLEVRSDFPHGLAIRVLEHHPAALIELGGRRVPVAGDGTILRGLPVEGRLPAIEVEDVKGAQRRSPGRCPGAGRRPDSRRRACSAAQAGGGHRGPRRRRPGGHAGRRSRVDLRRFLACPGQVDRRRPCARRSGGRRRHLPRPAASRPARGRRSARPHGHPGGAGRPGRARRAGTSGRRGGRRDGCGRGHGHRSRDHSRRSRVHAPDSRHHTRSGADGRARTWLPRIPRPECRRRGRRGPAERACRRADDPRLRVEV